MRVVAFARANEDLIDHGAFDEIHRVWCRSIIGYLARRGVPATFGRAAKFAAIFLKSMVIVGGNAEISQTRFIHPLADAILLLNMCKATDPQSAHKARWRKVKWTKLSEGEYYKIIDQLRSCVARGEPFWTLERLWTPMNDHE
jgi:hypothetical protein